MTTHPDSATGLQPGWAETTIRAGDVYRTSDIGGDEYWFARYNPELDPAEDPVFVINMISGDDRQKSYAYSAESFARRYPGAERVYRP